MFASLCSFICLQACLHSAVDLEVFFAASSTTMESLPLKELDFGLQKPTGPSSGVVASIVLVSPGLNCPGVSLAEVCATCPCGSLVIEVQHLEFYFHGLEKKFYTSVEHIYLMFNTYFLYHQKAHFIL